MSSKLLLPSGKNNNNKNKNVPEEVFLHSVGQFLQWGNVYMDVSGELKHIYDLDILKEIASIELVDDPSAPLRLYVKKSNRVIRTTIDLIPEIITSYRTLGQSGSVGGQIIQAVIKNTIKYINEIGVTVTKVYNWSGDSLLGSIKTTSDGSIADKTNAVVFHAIKRAAAENANRNKAFGSGVLTIDSHSKIIFNNKNPYTQTTMGNGIGLPNVLGFEDNDWTDMDANSMAQIAKTSLRAQIAEEISNRMRAAKGTRGLIALSRAAETGAGSSFLSLAPTGGAPGDKLKKRGINPMILQMSSGDPFINKYVGAINRTTQRGVGNIDEPYSMSNDTPGRIFITFKKFNDEIKDGRVDITNTAKGIYKVLQSGNGVVRGDVLFLDRSNSTAAVENGSNPLCFKNFTADEDDVIIERFELDLPLAPTARLSKARKKGKSATKARAKAKAKRKAKARAKAKAKAKRRRKK